MRIPNHPQAVVINFFCGAVSNTKNGVGIIVRNVLGQLLSHMLPAPEAYPPGKHELLPTFCNEILRGMEIFPIVCVLDNVSIFEDTKEIERMEIVMQALVDLAEQVEKMYAWDL